MSSPLSAPLRPDQRLALACACAYDKAVVRAAAAEIPDADWPEAARVLDHHFLAPAVLSRLNGLSADPLVAAVVARKKRGLLLQATMRSLQDDHLGCLGVAYAMFKGPSLGARYYGDPGLRVARDIDVLVGRADIEPVLRSLIAAGYGFLDRLQVRKSRRPTIDDAMAMTHLSKEVALVSPHGVCVEIHHRVDATGDAFPTAGLLARAETIEIWDRSWPVLTTADLFAYVCMHHALHRWSRLHWLLDLSMMMRHPSFDRDAALRRARDAGVRRTVEAAMHLPEAMSALLQGTPQPPAPRLTSTFVEDCLSCLEPETAPEQVRRRNPGQSIRHAHRDLAYQWRLRDTWKRRLAVMSSMVAPRIADYLAWPLPPQLHWIYWITRPLRLAARTAGRAIGRPRR